MVTKWNTLGGAQHKRLLLIADFLILIMTSDYDF